MKWSHLPVAGGLYDQHPKLLDQWMVLFEAQANEQKREADRQKAEAKGKRKG